MLRGARGPLMLNAWTSNLLSDQYWNLTSAAFIRRLHAGTTPWARCFASFFLRFPDSEIRFFWVCFLIWGEVLTLRQGSRGFLCPGRSQCGRQLLACHLTSQSLSLRRAAVCLVIVKITTVSASILPCRDHGQLGQSQRTGQKLHARVHPHHAPFLGSIFLIPMTLAWIHQCFWYAFDMLSSGEAGPQGRFHNKSACTLPDMICQVLALPRFWELRFVPVSEVWWCTWGKRWTCSRLRFRKKKGGRIMVGVRLGHGNDPIRTMIDTTTGTTCTTSGTPTTGDVGTKITMSGGISKFLDRVLLLVAASHASAVSETSVTSAGLMLPRTGAEVVARKGTTAVNNTDGEYDLCRASGVFFLLNVKGKKKWTGVHTVYGLKSTSSLLSTLDDGRRTFDRDTGNALAKLTNS